MTDEQEQNVQNAEFAYPMFGTTTASGTGGGGGYASSVPPYYSYSQGGVSGGNAGITWTGPVTWTGTYSGTYSGEAYPLKPNTQVLSRAETGELAKAMATAVAPGERIVICVDPDVAPEQIRDMQLKLIAEGISGLIICASAGSAYLPGVNRTDDNGRLDLLATIAELWSRRPDLTLAKLLEWFSGTFSADMSDSDFIAAFEANFRTVTGL